MSEPRRVDILVQRLTDAQPELFNYIVSLVPDVDLARDILQETNTVLWQKVEEYDPQTPFMAWACSVAKFKALSAARDRARDRHVFSAELMQRLADRMAESGATYDERVIGAVGRCVDKLPQHQRQMIEMRYGPGGSVARLAESLNRSAASISTTLLRVRKTLGECIERELRVERES
ncbi:MAG: sigma-70 family RNA polymerase sigma factor [Planctomycetes bacterium]|nr:sigma-70 family RNA polymerase sigma factor [Planctomycetota bacterium]